MTASSNEHRLVRSWYQKSLWLYLLAPLSLLYFLLAGVRRLGFRLGIFSSFKAAVPTIVVGNITVGGAGKTPVVIALVEALCKQGFKPGVISRGYGSDAPCYPYAVKADSLPIHCGDEPLLIAQQTGAPVVIDANRKSAITMLLEHNDCDVIVADDGLQHYALQRDIEIVVVDGQRGFGNAWLLPVGPLRELTHRLSQVDYIIANGKLETELPLPAATPFYAMTLQAQALQSLTTTNEVTMADWPYGKRVHAVAGIGNPARFFTTLRQLGFDPVEHAFADHYHYAEQDFNFAETLPIIMTAKDAVKVRTLQAPGNSWCLPVEAEIDPLFFASISQQIESLNAKRQQS